MTTQELLSISPDELEKLTDAELSLRLSPLFPQVRAAYIGARTSTVQVGNKKQSKASFEKNLTNLASVLAKLQTK